MGWLARAELPDSAEIRECFAKFAPQSTNGSESSVEPHRTLVIELRRRKVEKMAVWLILKDQHGYTGSYNSVLRFVHRLEPGTPEPCVRVETPPGEEAQVDFGYAGRFVDPATGQSRRAWVFVMTLSERLRVASHPRRRVRRTAEGAPRSLPKQPRVRCDGEGGKP